MVIQINLINKYYGWNKICRNEVSIFFKGTFYHDDVLLDSKNLTDLLFSIIENGINNFPPFLHKLNGEYSLIIDTPEHTICVVDRIRSIPLFYCQVEGTISISDDANFLRNKFNLCLSEKNAAEYLVTSFVTGDGTLFKDLKQIQAGEFFIYSKNTNVLEFANCHEYLHSDFFSLSENQLLELLDSTMVNIFKRLINSTVGLGSQIVVPLSGGLDSRLIVAMLHRLGVKDVICFSYGKIGNNEAKISKKIAESLGYSWYFVEYTKDKWNNCLESQDFNLYNEYGGNLVSLPHLQDFVAITELKECGIIPANSIFIPGHTGDMISGGYIPYLDDGFAEYTLNMAINKILKKHYRFWKWDDIAKQKSIFENHIKKSLNNFDIYDFGSYADSLEIFNFKERQAKYIVNSVRVYEFFGYGWRLPLWDLAIMNFYEKVPLRFRVKQNLYFSYCKILFNNTNLIPLLSIECTTNFTNNKIKVSKLMAYLHFIHNKIFPKQLITKSAINQDDLKLVENMDLLDFAYNLKLEHKGKYPYGNDICALIYLLQILKKKE